MHSRPLSFPGSTSESSVVENTLSVYETITAFLTPRGYFKTHATPRGLSPADYLGLITDEIGLVKPMKPRRKRDQG